MDDELEIDADAIAHARYLLEEERKENTRRKDGATGRRKQTIAKQRSRSRARAKTRKGAR